MVWGMCDYGLWGSGMYGMRCVEGVHQRSPEAENLGMGGPGVRKSDPGELKSAKICRAPAARELENLKVGPLVVC